MKSRSNISRVGFEETRQEEMSPENIDWKKVVEQILFNCAGRWTAGLIGMLLVLFLSTGAALAQQQSSSKDTVVDNDSYPIRGPGDVRFYDYFPRFPSAAAFGPKSSKNQKGKDIIEKRESKKDGTVQHHKSGPVFIWPVSVPTATSTVPTKRDEAINDYMLKTYGYPISDTQFQMIHRFDNQIMLEEMFDPEKVNWMGATMGATQAQDMANSMANATRNNAASAIDYVGCSLYNFTIDESNKWNKVRNELFLPMAILLLLPGAALAQLRVIVAAGMPIQGGEVNPFEGITRSIVAIFLIPATYLVVNYGIDLNNSLTYTIYTEYQRIFGSDMYKDATCAVVRANPIRLESENNNSFKEPSVKTDDRAKEKTTFAKREGLNFAPKYEPENCKGTGDAPKERAAEAATFLSTGQRAMQNSSNAALSMAWNILCAFQMVFLMYLWFVGPVVAALWVYPAGQLRGALPSWCEGVITLCFWSLFWNTVVLLMACFKGIDDTGTIIQSALMFLATASVKHAFDFAGLVKAAGEKAGGMAMGQAGSMAGAGRNGGSPSQPGAATSPGRVGGANPTGGSAGTHVGGANNPGGITANEGSANLGGMGGISTSGGSGDGGAPAMAGMFGGAAAAGALTAADGSRLGPDGKPLGDGRPDGLGLNVNGPPMMDAGLNGANQNALDGNMDRLRAMGALNPDGSINNAALNAKGMMVNERGEIVSNGNFKDANGNILGLNTPIANMPLVNPSTNSLMMGAGGVPLNASAIGSGALMSGPPSAFNPNSNMSTLQSGFQSLSVPGSSPGLGNQFANSANSSYSSLLTGGANGGPVSSVNAATLNNNFMSSLASARAADAANGGGTARQDAVMNGPLAQELMNNKGMDMPMTPGLANAMGDQQRLDNMNMAGAQQSFTGLAAQTGADVRGLLNSPGVNATTGQPLPVPAAAGDLANRFNQMYGNYQADLKNGTMDAGKLLNYNTQLSAIQGDIANLKTNPNSPLNPVSPNSPLNGGPTVDQASVNGLRNSVEAATGAAGLDQRSFQNIASAAGGGVGAYVSGAGPNYANQVANQVAQATYGTGGVYSAQGTAGVGQNGVVQPGGQQIAGGQIGQGGQQLATGQVGGTNQVSPTGTTAYGTPQTAMGSAMGTAIGSVMGQQQPVAGQQMGSPAQQQMMGTPQQQMMGTPQQQMMGSQPEQQMMMGNPGQQVQQPGYQYTASTGQGQAMGSPTPGQPMPGQPMPGQMPGPAGPVAGGDFTVSTPQAGPGAITSQPMGQSMQGPSQQMGQSMPMQGPSQQMGQSMPMQGPSQQMGQAAPSGGGEFYSQAAPAQSGFAQPSAPAPYQTAYQQGTAPTPGNVDYNNSAPQGSLPYSGQSSAPYQGGQGQVQGQQGQPAPNYNAGTPNYNAGTPNYNAGTPNYNTGAPNYTAPASGQVQQTQPQYNYNAASQQAPGPGPAPQQQYSQPTYQAQGPAPYQESQRYDMGSAAVPQQQGPVTPQMQGQAPAPGNAYYVGGANQPAPQAGPTYVNEADTTYKTQPSQQYVPTHDHSPASPPAQYSGPIPIIAPARSQSSSPSYNYQPRQQQPGSGGGGGGWFGQRPANPPQSGAGKGGTAGGQAPGATPQQQPGGMRRAAMNWSDEIRNGVLRNQKQNKKKPPEELPKYPGSTDEIV